MNIIFTNTSTDFSRVRLKAVKFLYIRITIYFEYAVKTNFPIAIREVKEEFPFFIVVLIGQFLKLCILWNI